MPITRTMIALTAVLAVLAAGLLIGLSQWSAHLEQGPTHPARASDNEGPDLATATDETAEDEAVSDDGSNAQPPNDTDDANGTGSADESSATAPTDERAAGDESSTPPDEPSDTAPESTSAASTQTESAQSAQSRKPPQPDPAMGDPDAPVTIVKFSEFYCPYCARFVWDTLPQIEETYVKTGKVRFVFRNLTVHGMAAIEAAIAGECAHDQDDFWEYAHAIFERVFPDRNLSNSQQLEPADLKDIAADIGLNTDAFNRCYANFENTMAQCQADYESCQQETNDDACNAAYVDCLRKDAKFAAIMADREALSALIDDLPSEDQKRAERIGTPTFFVNGRLLIGAQPFSAFERIIEEELDRASSSP